MNKGEEWNKKYMPWNDGVHRRCKQLATASECD